MDERVYTNTNVTITLEVIFSIIFDDTRPPSDLQVLEDSEGKAIGFSIRDRQYKPMLIFEEVTEGIDKLISDSEIEDTLGLQVQQYTDNCSVLFD